MQLDELGQLAMPAVKLAELEQVNEGLCRVWVSSRDQAFKLLRVNVPTVMGHMLMPWVEYSLPL